MKLNKAKQHQLDKTYHTFLQACLYDMPLTELEPFLADDVMNFGAGKKEITKTKQAFLKQIKNQKKLAAGLTMDFTFKPVLRKIIDKGRGAVYSDDVVNTVWVNGVENKLEFRLSYVFEYRKDKWIIVHSHTSAPDAQRSEDEIWPLEELKKRTAVLEKSLDEKIAELEIKNHELIVEAALERVRTVAMGLKKSSELINVCEIVYKELIRLGFSNILNAQVTINQVDKKSYWVFDYSDLGVVVRQEIPVDNSSLVGEPFKKTGKSKDAFFQKRFSGGAFKDWRKEREDLTKVNDPRLAGADSISCYLFVIGIGHFAISTVNGVTKSQLATLKRFKNVLELCYLRFMDVVQAEANASEAKMETALERIRNRTMAMRQSDELAQIVSLVFKQLVNLGIAAAKMRTCAIITLATEEPVGECWITNPEGEIIPNSFLVSYDDTSAYQPIYKAWKNGEKFYVVHLAGEALAQHLMHLKKFAKIPTQQFQALPDQPTETFTHALFFSQGYLLIISNEPLTEYYDILKRFGEVFQQTYTRFLDLKQAETQAREARMEASLERVRSKAMAMQKSEDLSNAVALVFRGTG